VSSTQFRIQFLIFFTRFSARLAIGFYCRLHNFLELERLAFCLTISPTRLNRSTKGSAFDHLEPDHWETENVGDGLAHAGTFGAASGNAQFFGFDPKTNQSVHPLSKSDYDSFD